MKAKHFLIVGIVGVAILLFIGVYVRYFKNYFFMSTVHEVVWQTQCASSTIILTDIRGNQNPFELGYQEDLEFAIVTATDTRMFSSISLRLQENGSYTAFPVLNPSKITIFYKKFPQFISNDSLKSEDSVWNIRAITFKPSNGNSEIGLKNEEFTLVAECLEEKHEELQNTLQEYKNNRDRKFTTSGSERAANIPLRVNSIFKGDDVSEVDLTLEDVRGLFYEGEDGYDNPNDVYQYSGYVTPGNVQGVQKIFFKRISGGNEPLESHGLFKGLYQGILYSDDPRAITLLSKNPIEPKGVKAGENFPYEGSLFNSAHNKTGETLKEYSDLFEKLP